MARISAYEDAHDNLIWVVERSDGEGRKEFRSHDEAESYKNYLQSLENQEKALSQNQQIIDNQNKIIEQNRISQQTPRIQRVKQVLDPEYEEWLRYKKATDPDYQKWKAEEERKKRAKIEEERKKAIEREREENKRYFDLKKRDIAFHKQRIDNYIKVYKQVANLYEEVINVSFIASKRIEYYTEDSYDHFQIVGGVHLNDYDQKIKSSYDYLKVHYNTEISDLNRFCDYIYQLAEMGERTRFDDKLKVLSGIDNQFWCFYDYLVKRVKDIIEEYNTYSNPYYYDNRFYYNSDKPRGLFIKQKIKNTIQEYLSNNEKNYNTVKNIYQNLIELLKICNLRY